MFPQDIYEAFIQGNIPLSILSRELAQGPLPNELTLRKRASAKMTNFTNSISKGTKKAAFVIKLGSI